MSGNTTFKTRNTRAAKLTVSQVEELKSSYANGETQGSLAKRYGLSVTHVGRIVRGESWNHTQAGRVDFSENQIDEIAQRALVSALAVQEKMTKEEPKPLERDYNHWSDGLTIDEIILGQKKESFMSSWNKEEQMDAYRKECLANREKA